MNDCAHEGSSKIERDGTHCFSSVNVNDGVDKVFQNLKATCFVPPSHALVELGGKQLPRLMFLRLVMTPVVYSVASS